MRSVDLFLLIPASDPSIDGKLPEKVICLIFEYDLQGEIRFVRFFQSDILTLYHASGRKSRS